MKYFTEQWCYSQLDDDEIESIAIQYDEYIDNIFPELPYVLKMLTKGINLHDGLIKTISFYQKNNSLTIEGIFGDLQIGYFYLVIKYIGVKDIDLQALENKKLEVLSSEIELLSNFVFSHKMFFSIKQEIEIIFSNIEIKVSNASPQKYLKTVCKLKIT